MRHLDFFWRQQRGITDADRSHLLNYNGRQVGHDFDLGYVLQRGEKRNAWNTHAWFMHSWSEEDKQRQHRASQKHILYIKMQKTHRFRCEVEVGQSVQLEEECVH